jgi:hypothetical protein
VPLTAGPLDSGVRIAYLGDYAFTPEAGRGLTTEGLALVIDALGLLSRSGTGSGRLLTAGRAGATLGGHDRGRGHDPERKELACRRRNRRHDRRLATP